MGPLDSLSILLVSMNLIWVFKNTWYILLFSYLENLYHAKERGRYERTPNGTFQISASGGYEIKLVHPKLKFV